MVARHGGVPHGPSSPEPPTEADLLDLLAARYAERAGNGRAWAFARHVRDAAGFDARRTADAVAVALWPSRGLLIHGFEVKVSRGDWLRELRDQDKAGAFADLVDCWWVVAPEGVVRRSELPPGWGLLAARETEWGSGIWCLRTSVMAVPLRGTVARPSWWRDDLPLPPDFGRSFLAALLRAAQERGDAGGS